MTRIELKNGANFGNYVTCVMLTVAQRNPLTDDELIANATTHFEESFGNAPWWIGISRKPITVDENITVVFQMAPKNYRRISDPKHILYNNNVVINGASIESAISSAKSRCMVPTTSINAVPKQVQATMEPKVTEGAGQG